MPLDQVQQTLLFPLLGRAEAARRWPQAFQDPWASQAWTVHAATGSQARQLGDFSTAVYGVRHLLNVREVNAYLREHPGASVVNIGCGLDRIVLELEDQEAVVYNLDFPEVLELRRHWIEPHPRERELPFSVTDHRWMDQVEASRGMIAVAAGVFYYLEVEDVRSLVAALGDRFPGSRLCYDAESPSVTNGSEQSIRRNGTPEARMPFRVKDPRSVATWSQNIADVRIEWDFSAYLDDRSVLPRRIRWIFTGFRLAHGMYEVIVTFDGEPGGDEPSRPDEGKPALTRIEEDWSP